MTQIYDMHCHLGFAPDAEGLARGGAQAGIGALSCTVTPAGFAAERALTAPYPHLHAALGLHPWWVADGRVGEADLVLFEELAGRTPFIGEVGLDFAGARAAAREVQVAALRRVLAATAGRGGTLYSVHAVRAADTVLDLMDEAGVFAPDAGNDVVFHWFSGTPAELARARARGCLFSVGSRMLATHRGRAYGHDLPADRLLLETDAPSHPGEPLDAGAWEARLDDALAQLAAARGDDAAELGAALAATSARLLAR